MSAADLLRLDLVVNIRFPGTKASGIQVAAMAEALADTGLVVDVIAPRRYPYRDIDPWEHYGVRRTFQVHRIASFDTIDMVSTRYQRLPFLVQSASFAWRALARIAVERHTGVLVRDHYTLDVLVRGLRDRDLGRLATEVHSLPVDAVLRRRAARSLRRIPAVIVISTALRDDLIGEGVDPEAILLARDGVHLHRFDGLPDPKTARRHLGLDVDAPTVVYAGQLYRWKGVDALLEGMVRLPNVQLLVVGGDAEHLPRVIALAQTHAPGRVTFTGTLPHAAVPFHLAAGDVVAVPNSGAEEISTRYTSPLKLFEAMAAARPIVASDLPSLREVLTHERNAHLVPPDDPVAFAEGLRVVLNDPARAGRLAAQAHRDAKRYTWAERGTRVAKFLRQRLRMGGRS